MSERKLLYPAYLGVVGRDVLVVGAGRVAVRKVVSLLRCGAIVTVVSPEWCQRLIRMRERGMIQGTERGYEDGDLEGKWLVIAATDDSEVNQRVYEQATERRIFCNVVDRPELCSFQVPAVVRRGLLQIAVSTGGASPSLARDIRIQLQDLFGDYYAEYVDGLKELRRYYKAEWPEVSSQRRAARLQGFLDSGALESLHDGNRKAFGEMMAKWKKKKP